MTMAMREMRNDIPISMSKSASVMLILRVDEKAGTI